MKRFFTLAIAFHPVQTGFQFPCLLLNALKLLCRQFRRKRTLDAVVGPYPGSDHRQFLAQQPCFPKNGNEGFEGFLENQTPVLTKVVEGPEILLKSIDEPFDADAPPILLLQPPRGAHVLDAAIKIQIQQVMWIITRTPCPCRHSLFKALPAHFKPVHKSVHNRAC